MPSGERLKKLREEAEKTIHEIGNGNYLPGQVEVNLQKLLHELQVHQIELEMQNEELTRVQNLLEIEKNRYAELFDYSPVGYLIMDKNGFIHEANQTFCKMSGLPKSEVANHNLKSLLDSKSQDAFYFHLRDLMEGKKTANCILEIRHAETSLWIKMESKLFFFTKINEQVIQSSVSDISATKATEEHLLRLSAAFEQSANSIVVTDTNGNIEYANPRFFKTTGFTPDEVIGQNPSIVKYDKSQIDYKELWKTITSGQTWKGEFLNKTKKGKLYWEIATITPVKNHEGKIINYLAIKEDITQRKQAEEKLQKAKDFYLNLLKDFPVMVWQCDTEGKFNFFNKTFSEFTGHTNQELSEKDYNLMIYNKDREVFKDAFRKGLENKVPFIVEYRIKDRFDNYRWVLNHAKPFTDLEGNYGGFIATNIDIHDRKRVEERLIESEDKYRRMFEDSSLGIFKLDRNFSFINANKAFAEMFGYDDTVSFLIDINNHPDRFFPEFGKEREFRKQLVKSKESRFVVEKELFRKDKSRIYTLIHLRKVYERSHVKQFYMEGFIEDITQRKLAEKKIILSEQKFKALFEKSYDAVLILDNLMVVDCNRKASELFNLECGSLAQVHFRDLCPEFQYNHQQSSLLLQKKYNEALKGEAQTFEWLHLRDGKSFDAEVSFARIYVKNKYMIQAIIRDISAKKLAEKQLKQAKEDAEKARMAQSEFLSLMSHEIRTPLNAVVSLTDLMLHEELSKDQRENLGTVKISARHLLGLIDDILDYNKIESGNIQFETEDFNIRQLVDQIIKALIIKAKERNNKLIAEVEENVPRILRSDTLRLKQILINLISNAIKFTQDGQITLKVEKQEGNNHNIRFLVKDSGIGISANRLDAIFEKFTQEESSTTRKYGGSGLGLTICKKLVELQGGEITAQSEVGKGSEFSFYIPMEPGEKAAEDLMEITQNQNNYTLAGMKILMVEDDKMNQFVGRKVIEKKWNASLTIVSSGEEALEMLSERNFDLVLMDILLPKMDGYEVVEKIRKNQNQRIIQPDVPIIALTADAFVETRQKALEAGMNDFVSKPFDYDNLYKKIHGYKPTC
ncbi:MAG: PAS domain S-box protein [bacterium]